MKKTVRFEYERSVRWGQEQATLHDAMASLAAVASSSKYGTLYRKVYGTSDAAVLQTLQSVRSSGGPSILVDTALAVPKDLQPPPPDESNVTPQNLVAKLQNLNGAKSLTPQQAADLCNAMRLAGKLPQAQIPDGPFTADMFVPDANGEFRTYTSLFGAFATAPAGTASLPSARAPASISALLRTVLGSAATFVTPGDVSVLEQAHAAAEGLGVSLAEIRPLLGKGERPQDAALFSLRADWSANDLSLGERASIDVGDWLRFNAERPGGHNYDRSLYETLDARERGGQALGLATGNQDVFNDSSARRKAIAEIGSAAEQMRLGYDVRRPDEAVQKQDTYAVLRIANGFDESIDIYAKNDAKFKTLFQTNRFMIRSASESRAERVQLVETFGPTYLYLFGERANVWTYGGVLMDTRGLDWLNEWRAAWKTITGGTRTALAKARAFFIYRDVVREGILIATEDSMTVDTFGFANFSFSLFVIREHFLDGDLSPGVKAHAPTDLQPKAGQMASAAANYDVSFEDTTPKLGAGSSVSQAVRAVEGDLVRGRTGEIEAGIKSQAFVNGELVVEVGTVLLPAEAAQARESIERNVRIVDEADMAPKTAVTQ